MNAPVLNPQMPMPAAIQPTGSQPSAFNPETLELRDIHLPDPISWWPIAPGWWLLLIGLILLIAIIFITRKIYRSRQLRRDIKAELEGIKKQFQQSQNKVELAKALSILLRRASISFYPEKDIAGLIGKDWLSYLDATHAATSDKKFHSTIGETLLTAPYLPDNAELDLDAQALIQLCESWLRAPHKKMPPATQTQHTQSPAAPLRGSQS